MMGAVMLMFCWREREDRKEGEGGRRRRRRRRRRRKRKETEGVGWGVWRRKCKREEKHSRNVTFLIYI